MKFILGTKIEMTQIYKGDIAVPVTRVKMLPGVVMQIKTVATEGYNAVVVGFGERRAKNIAKPQLGAMKGLGTFRYIKEFRAKNTTDAAEQAKLIRGNAISFETFAEGDVLNVVGTSKGKGFQGGVKRHRFHGHNTTHGTKDQVRMPGSIGAGEPQHVFKGTRMAGHMGDERVSVKNLELIAIDADKAELFIKGALPGARNGVLYISAPGELKVEEASVIAPEPVVAEVEAVVEEKVESSKNEVESEASPVVTEVKEEKTVAPIVTVEAPKEVKAEDIVAEVAAEAAAEAAPEVKVEDHVAKFKALSAQEQAKYSSEEVQALITKLEEEYKTDLVPVVMKLAVKELSVDDLVAYFTKTAKMEVGKAEELVKVIKEQILK
jgi:large subunit ribosomal protein L3